MSETLSNASTSPSRNSSRRRNARESSADSSFSLSRKLQLAAQEKNLMLAQIQSLKKKISTSQSFDGTEESPTSSSSVIVMDAKQQQDTWNKLLEANIRFGTTACLWCIKTQMVKKLSLAFHRWKSNVANIDHKGVNLNHIDYEMDAISNKFDIKTASASPSDEEKEARRQYLLTFARKIINAPHGLNSNSESSRKRENDYTAPDPLMANAMGVLDSFRTGQPQPQRRRSPTRSPPTYLKPTASFIRSHSHVGSMSGSPIAALSDFLSSHSQYAHISQPTQSNQTDGFVTNSSLPSSSTTSSLSATSMQRRRIVSNTSNKSTVNNTRDDRLSESKTPLTAFGSTLPRKIPRAVSADRTSRLRYNFSPSNPTPTSESSSSSRPRQTNEVFSRNNDKLSRYNQSNSAVFAESTSSSGRYSRSTSNGRNSSHSNSNSNRNSVVNGNSPDNRRMRSKSASPPRNRSIITSDYQHPLSSRHVSIFGNGNNRYASYDATASRSLNNLFLRNSGMPMASKQAFLESSVSMGPRSGYNEYLDGNVVRTKNNSLPDQEIEVQARTNDQQLSTNSGSINRYQLNGSQDNLFERENDRRKDDISKSLPSYSKDYDTPVVNVIPHLSEEFEASVTANNDVNQDLQGTEIFNTYEGITYDNLPATSNFNANINANINVSANSNPLRADSSHGNITSDNLRQNSESNPIKDNSEDIQQLETIVETDPKRMLIMKMKMKRKAKEMEMEKEKEKLQLNQGNIDANKKQVDLPVPNMTGITLSDPVILPQRQIENGLIVSRLRENNDDMDYDNGMSNVDDSIDYSDHHKSHNSRQYYSAGSVKQPTSVDNQDILDDLSEITGDGQGGLNYRSQVPSFRQTISNNSQHRPQSLRDLNHDDFNDVNDLQDFQRHENLYPSNFDSEATRITRNYVYDDIKKIQGRGSNLNPMASPSTASSSSSSPPFTSAMTITPRPRSSSQSRYMAETATSASRLFQRKSTTNTPRRSITSTSTSTPTSSFMASPSPSLRSGKSRHSSPSSVHSLPPANKMEKAQWNLLYGNLQEAKQSWADGLRR